MDSPDRTASTAARYQLLQLDASGANPLPFEGALSLAAIYELPELFQPRGRDLILSPGKSEVHVRKLATLVRAGGSLDPVVVISFGSDWFLVDGHHRLEAYRRVKSKVLVPALALTTNLRGKERVAFALKASVADNVKDRLALSNSEKLAAAWRMVLRGEGSKREQAHLHGVSESVVGTMRRVAGELRTLGHGYETIIGWDWERARWEANKPDDNDRTAFDLAEHRRRLLSKKMVEAMRLRPSANELLEVLASYNEGLGIELHTALTTGDWAGGVLREIGLDV